MEAIPENVIDRKMEKKSCRNSDESWWFYKGESASVLKQRDWRSPISESRGPSRCQEMAECLAQSPVPSTRPGCCSLAAVPPAHSTEMMGGGTLGCSLCCSGEVWGGWSGEHGVMPPCLQLPLHFHILHLVYVIFCPRCCCLQCKP